MFSNQGFFVWWFDSVALQMFFWWELYAALMRQVKNDWTYLDRQRYNHVDKNRVFGRTNFVDPYDFHYWSTREDGIDCNGNVGYGNYCYCPSQGYNCQCQPNDWYAQGQVRNMCNDHYGYDCDGNYVDGENNWCNDQSNIYWFLN